MCLQPTACTVEQSVICAKWIVRIEAYATTLEASAGASTDSTDPTVQLLTRMQCTPTGMSCNLSFIASQVSQSAVDCDQDLHQINDISLDDDLNLFESTGSLKIIFVCFSIHFNRCPSVMETSGSCYCVCFNCRRCQAIIQLALHAFPLHFLYSNLIFVDKCALITPDV